MRIHILGTTSKTGNRRQNAKKKKNKNYFKEKIKKKPKQSLRSMSAQLINGHFSKKLPSFNSHQLNNNIHNSTFNNVNNLEKRNTSKVTLLDLPTLYDIPKSWFYDNSNINRVDTETDQASIIKATKTRKITKKRRNLRSENKRIENNSLFQLSTIREIDIRNETIYDGAHKWIPIHAITSYNAPWWTHFLVAKDDLSLLRCKHCDTTTTIRDKETINVDLIFHLGTCHLIDRNVDFYDKKSQLKPHQNVNSISSITDQPTGIHITPCPSLYSRRNLKSTLFMTQENNEQEDEEIEEEIQNGNSMSDSISNDILLTIMMIAQNIPLSFTENPLFSSLIEYVPQDNPVKRIDIEDNIVNISEEIENLLKNTISHSFPIYFKTNDIMNDTENVFDQVRDTLERNLLCIENAAIFSLSFHIWSNRYFIITAMYFDDSTQTQKTIPLSFTQIDITKEKIDGFFISQKFQELYNRYPGLCLSTLTITLPNKNIIRHVKQESIDFFATSVTNISNNQLRVCVLTSICSAIENLFGTYISVEEHSDSVTSFDPIDILINLKNIDINSSIFGKINLFYGEILSDPTQAARFVDICYDLEIKVPRIKFFDPKKPSTAIEFLTQFEGIIDVVLEMEPYLKNEKFTDNDFKVIHLLINFLESTYSIINHLLGDTMYLPIFSLMLLHQFEQQLTSIIKEIHFSRFTKGFSRCLEHIVETIRLLTETDSSKLASFFIPYVLMNGQMQQNIYYTIKTSKIVSICSNIGLGLLNKFIDINQPEEESIKNSSGRKESDDPFFKGLPFQFVELNREPNKVGVVLDGDTPLLSSVKDLLSQEIESDLNHYLISVSSEYLKLHDKYIDMKNYEYNGKTYKNKTTDDFLTPLQELEFIHLPICRDFLSKYLSSDIGLLFKILVKFVCTESSSSIRNEYLYLSNYTPNVPEEFIESCLKIKVLNEQFNIGRTDLGTITLTDLCKYSQ